LRRELGTLIVAKQWPILAAEAAAELFSAFKRNYSSDLRLRFSSNNRAGGRSTFAAIALSVSQ